MKILHYSILLFSFCLLAACNDFLETAVETKYQEDDVFVNYSRMSNAGYGVYTTLFNFGFNRINSAMLASACDEADHADVNSSVQHFNTGTWSSSLNPDDCWNAFYTAIRRANLFLEGSTDYKTILFRDTTVTANAENYRYQVRDIQWLRAEARFLRALYHFELVKRYGGIPIMKEIVDDEATLLKITRANFDDCIDFIVTECNETTPLLKDTWVDFDGNKWRGRATKGAAQALKAQALLYAASPLHNPSNDLKRWSKAAEAAHDIIASGKFSLHNNYRGLFNLGNGSDSNPEVLFAVQRWNENSFEKYNYPIAESHRCLRNAKYGQAYQPARLGL